MLYEKDALFPMEKTRKKFTLPEKPKLGPIPISKGIAPSSVESLFNADLIFCMKSFQALSLKEPSPGKYRIKINQYFDCINKYQTRVSSSIIAEKMMEFGENLVELMGFHELAKQHCFDREKLLEVATAAPYSSAAEISKSYNEITNSLEPVFNNNSFRVFLGLQNAEFVSLLSRDFGFQNKETIEGYLRIQENIIIATKDYSAKEQLFLCIYNAIEMARFVQEKNPKVMVISVNDRFRKLLNGY
jgi:hypothetical protein